MSYNGIGDNQMNEFFGFIKEIFMMKTDSGAKVGLSQFKAEKVQPIRKDVSIRNKDVKLSDLMRRVS